MTFLRDLYDRIYNIFLMRRFARRLREERAKGPLPVAPYVVHRVRRHG